MRKAKNSADAAGNELDDTTFRRAIKVHDVPDGNEGTGLLSDPGEIQQCQCSVVLEGFESGKKIGVIKLVREFTGLGLVEARALVESLPKPVKSDLDGQTAEQMKSVFEKAGARVRIVSPRVNPPKTVEPPRPATDPPGDDVGTAVFRANLLNHFRKARDAAILNLSRPQK